MTLNVLSVLVTEVFTDLLYFAKLFQACAEHGRHHKYLT